jgi:hypothetical protein
MKPMKTLLPIAVVIISYFSCSTSASDKGNCESVTRDIAFSTSEFTKPDSALFYFKHLSRTPNGGDFSLFSKMNSLDSNQVNNWLQPILKDVKIQINYGESGFSVKMVSFQKKTKCYTSIIIALAYDEVQQFYTTIDTTGKIIDGLRVSYIDNLSNSDVEYLEVRSVYKFSTKVLSYFDGDTIRMYSIEDVSILEEPHESKDVWKEIYETEYVVNHAGRIHLLSERKQVDVSKLEDLQKEMANPIGFKSNPNQYNSHEHFASNSR